jgi:hypothetical protein
MRGLLCAAILLAAPGVTAASPKLILPIVCVPGENCWPVRYVDHDPGPGQRDYACGPETGDSHRGTDIALRDLQAMAEGVRVLATAAGTVVGTRDGEPDAGIEQLGSAALDGRDCGNEVRIDHGEGWATQYCHLRRGSVRVVDGDRVQAGQSLGLVGLSGMTNFPHLHLGVFQDGEAVDPFRGVAGGPDCAPGIEPLWTPETLAALAYRPAVLNSAGFATAAPTAEDIRRGWHLEKELSASSPALVLWVDGFWLELGDRLTFTITAPDGTPVVEQQQEIEAAHRRYFAFAGRKRPGDAWPPGSYRGEIALERDSDSGRPLQESLNREVVLR